MLAALRIVVDVAQYRLRRLEMANIAGALAIGFVLHLDLDELAGRIAFALLLNVLVYLNNDFHDLESDLSSASKGSEKTQFLSNHRIEAVVAQLALLVVLATIAIAWRPGLLVPLIVGGGVCWLYSARLKRIAGFDVAAMILWGAAMPIVGMPLSSATGWTLVGQLALFSGCFECIQVLRDHDEDRQQGIRTTAVVLGPDATRRLIRSLLAGAALYAGLFFHPAIALLPAGALFLPIETGQVRVYWNRIRLVLGIAFVIECALVFGG